MKKDLLLLISALILVNISLANNNKSKLLELISSNHDTTYIERIDNTLGLKLFYINKYSSLQIGSRNFDEDISYQANSNHSTGLGVIYGVFDINFGYSRKNTKRGDSKKIDFQTQMYLPTSTLRLSITRFKGFYIDNAEKLINNWQTGNYYIRDDIEATTINATANYFFNHQRYSNKVLFAHQALQKRTAGSFLAGIAFGYNGVRGDSSFIPERIIDTAAFNISITNVNYYSLGGNIGYAFNIVIRKHWFIGGLIAPGISYAYNKQSSNEGENTENTMNFYLQTEFGIGYNSNRFFIGANRCQTSARAPIGHEHNSLELRNGKTNVMFVYRFKLKNVFNFLSN